MEPVNSISWKSPSNLALIKYWGKKQIQKPQNPSISFTLKNAFTVTEVKYFDCSDKQNVDFYFHGNKNPHFEDKIKRYIKNISDYLPNLKQYNFEINSKNSFPHSVGIASSSSSMSALALCLCEIDNQKVIGDFKNNLDFLNKASNLARLGSGSAARSLYGPMAIWGACSKFSSSSDDYAIPFIDSHEIFSNYQNTILVVSSTPKSVSSTQGHVTMNGHFLAQERYTRAIENLEKITVALKCGDLECFGEIIEEEALTLHALMANTRNPFFLYNQNTIKILELIRQYRKETNNPVYFTLDAGPNVHMLYPENIKVEVDHFVASILKEFCENGKTIEDEIGIGPERIEVS